MIWRETSTDKGVWGPWHNLAPMPRPTPTLDTDWFSGQKLARGPLAAPRRMAVTHTNPALRYLRYQQGHFGGKLGGEGEIWLEETDKGGFWRLGITRGCAKANPDPRYQQGRFGGKGT